MSFFENLSVRYNGLTKQGKRLADYIRKYPEAALKMTAKSLGKQSGTSAAAVIRFCRQLGYESLELMKISLAVESVSGDELSSPIDTIISSGDSVSEIAEKLLFNMTTALRRTLEIIDYEDLKKVIHMIEKAKLIYVFGIGASRFAAQEFSHRLSRLGRPCIYQIEGHTNLELASVADKKDIIVAFSYSGETKEVYLAAESAHSRGVPVISITRDRPNSLRNFSTVSIIIPDSERRIRVGAFSSRATQMFIGDIIYLNILQKNFSEIETLFMETSRIVNKLRE